MNKKLLIICIIVFLTKTGNVFSSNSIFDVNNIIITNYNYQNKEKLLDRAFKDGFYKLTEKILQKKDSDSLKKIGLKEIRQLVSSYQIIENKDFNKKNEVTINLSFSRNKINNLFYKNNISYADVSKTDLVIFPVLIENNNFYLYEDNYFYDNWIKDEEKTFKFINYILPIENLSDIEIISKNKENLESINVNDLLSNYGIKNYLFFVIKPSKNSVDVFIKGLVSEKKVVKNLNYSLSNNLKEERFSEVIQSLKQDINEVWKSENLIDVRTPSFLNVNLDLNKQDDLLILQKKFNEIDLIENFYVLELNKNYAKIKIKYLGKIDKMKNKFNDKGIKVKIKNNQWIIELI